MSEGYHKDVEFIRSSFFGEQCLFNEEILKDARKAYRSLSSVRTKMDALMDIISLCRYAGRHDELMVFLQEAANDPVMAPAKQDIFFYMGEACKDADQCKKALEYYLVSMEQESPRKDIRYSRLVQAAFCWVLEGEPEKALEFCRKAVVIDPDRWIAWKNLGMAYECLDDPGQAAECFSRAVRLSNGNVVPIVHLRELVKHRGRDIKGLKEIREELSEKMGVLV